MPQQEDRIDALVLMNDVLFNRTLSAILREQGISCLVEEDTIPAIIRPTLEKYNPAITLVGAYLGKPRVRENDVHNFKLILAHYRKKFPQKIPLLMVAHEQEPDFKPSEELRKILYVLQIPVGTRTQELTRLLMDMISRMNEECSLDLLALSRQESVQAEEPSEIYKEKDFSAEYSMQEHKLVLKGPLIGRAFSKIDMVLKNEKVHQDVKAFAPRDRDTKRILIVDWKDVTYVTEKAEHYTFVVFKDLMRNGIYERIRFENFLDKEKYFTNKTHFELYVNRFCQEQSGSE
jgi:hypothetical protein